MTDDDPNAKPAYVQPSPWEVFQRYLPVVAIGAMITTFLLMPPAIAVTLIGAVWLVATRLSQSRRFFGLTLTEALAWSATLIIFELVLAVIVYGVLSPPAS